MIEQLQDRRAALEAQTEITPDYAEAWNQLAADFESVGMLVNAERCRARWQQYRLVFESPILVTLPQSVEA